MSRMNIFIVFSVLLIMTFSMVLAGILFYTKSAAVLSEIYQEEIVRNLEQMDRSIQDNIAMIDSVYAQLTSNTLIRDNLDPAAEEYVSSSAESRRMEIERQMGYMLVNNYLWTENLIRGVYIIDNEEECARFAKTYGPDKENALKVARQCDRTDPQLQIRGLEGEHGSVYFVRNIFSLNTGRKNAAAVIEMSSYEWARLFAAVADENWLVLINNADLRWSIGPEFYEDEQIDALLAAAENHFGFQETSVLGTEYFIASSKTDAAGLTTAVAAPKEYLLRDLEKARASFLLMYSIIAVAAMFFTLAVIVLVTKPIKQMTGYVRDVAQNRAAAKRPKGLFKELDGFVESFNEMLARLETYYSDLHEQKLLLKNAEIKALQAQMDPHFLFNVMNTIAWKAEISGNSEVYDMVISLSEMLRANAMSNDESFITLKEELDYVRLYIYLQQKRFDGKFSVSIDHSGVPGTAQVPRLCIQPLVENAILHGFEPLPDDGQEWLLSVCIKPEGNGIRVTVEDNGTGFPHDFDIETLKTPEDSNHSHIALNNLNKRLAWIGGADNKLLISSEKGKTTVSFWVPDG